MNPLRRSLLRLLGAAGAVTAAPGLALAERIRILPDGSAPVAPGTPGVTSPELSRALGALTPGPAVAGSGLAVVWLLGGVKGDPAPLEVLTLDEARASSALTVVERAQASVPELIAENRGQIPVLLLAGEILIGGKQNRVLREDLVLPPLSGPRNIAVYCVEQGRWNEGRKEFESRASVVQSSVRSQVLGKADQRRIWSGVAAATQAAHAAAPTGSYQAVYESSDVRAHLDRAARHLETPAPGARGAAVFVGSRLAGVDVFHAASLFAREWPKLLRAHALDTYRAPAGAWDEAAARHRLDGLLRDARRAEGTRRPSPGAGHLFEFAIERQRGAALLVEEQMLHLAIL